VYVTVCVYVDVCACVECSMFVVYAFICKKVTSYSPIC